MKILVYQWNNFMAQSLLDICNEMNIDRDYFQWDFFTKGKEEHYEEFESFFEKNYIIENYDFVISINYKPAIAKVCNKHNVKYVAWCCDCPLTVPEDDTTMFLETNYIFLFDYIQCATYKEKGIDTVYHLPLGANSAAVKRINNSPEMIRKYSADISFVGRLYESEYQLITQLLDDEAKKVLGQIVNSQEELYNYNLVNECATEDLVAYMNDCYSKKLNGNQGSFVMTKPALRFALMSEVTRRNRLVLLSLLAKRHTTNLYSTQTFPEIADINQCGPVVYETEMPYVFINSKINLNPTLRCIDTGVPLRAFDIMGFGGFLLSNYQEELAQMYVDGEDMVLYDSYEDAIAKAEFYLKNEGLRKKIAVNGFKKTNENYTLQRAFLKILNILGF